MTDALCVSPGVPAAGGRLRELLPWLGSLPGWLREADGGALVRCVGRAAPLASLGSPMQGNGR